MNALDHFRRMARNNLWSNHRLHGAVLALGPGEFEAARASFFPSIRATLNHILAVDLYYLDMLEEAGRGLAVLNGFVERADPSALAAAQLDADRTGQRMDTRGVGRIDDTIDLVGELNHFGVDTSNLMQSAENFIQVWERGYAVRSPSPLPRR